MHYVQGRTVDLSTETMDPRKNSCNIFKVPEEKNNFSRVLCPVKISFRNKGKIKTFSDKGKLKDFIASKPALKYIYI